ncbi:MAG: DUF983 domain-containing protein [Rhodospirillales bacterium]|nr:DUF983 domain-containing protein [Rhodospirillales bacterium]
MTGTNLSKITCVLRGWRRLCPRCGRGRLLRSFLKPVEACSDCGEAYGHMRADDFPPYLTIFIVGHIVVPLVLMAHQRGLPVEIASVLWVPTTLVLTLLLLPRCKGAVLALMWSLGLTGNEKR